MTRGKVSTQVQTPPGSPNTIQGQAVLGYGHGDAAASTSVTWVIR
jgi:hypothetical protein